MKVDDSTEADSDKIADKTESNIKPAATELDGSSETVSPHSWQDYIGDSYIDESPSLLSDEGSFWTNLFGAQKKSLQETNQLFPERKVNLLNQIMLAFIRIVAAIIAAILFIRVWHFLTPLSWQWLSLDQIAELDRLLFTGAIGTFFGKYVKSAFNKED